MSGCIVMRIGRTLVVGVLAGSLALVACTGGIPGFRPPPNPKLSPPPSIALPGMPIPWSVYSYPSLKSVEIEFRASVCGAVHLRVQHEPGIITIYALWKPSPGSCNAKPKIQRITVPLPVQVFCVANPPQLIDGSTGMPALRSPDAKIEKIYCPNIPYTPSPTVG
jgi:hypothetical protein